MKRFSLVGRFGPGDRASVRLVQTDSKRFNVNFVNADRRLDFGLGHAVEQLRALGLRPSEMALDLLVLAALVNAADTRISRGPNAQDGWTREIDLYTPVSDAALWRGVAGSIQDTLRFLTGDRWRLVFRTRPRRFEAIIAAPEKLPFDAFDDVCLFSGGLDSFIGVIDLLAAGQRPLLVSHYWDTKTAKVQAYLLERLRKRFPMPEIRSIRVRLGFNKNDLNTRAVEDTQRGRSFLFFALAALAADAFGKPMRIVVPENGLIALNVPLDPLRFGALSTRTAHPYFIARMNHLFDALGLKVYLENPYRHRTKGEMVAGCADLGFLRKEAPYSMSCSSPAKARFQRLSPRHCGFCVPCLIRRAALKAGLYHKDPTLYTIPDLNAQKLYTDRAEGEDIRSFQLMAARIHARPNLAKILVHKPGPLIDAPAEISLYADVFRRGVLEVASLIDGIRAEPSR